MEWIFGSKKIWNMMENKHGRIDLLTKEQIVWCKKHCDFEWFVKDNKKVYSKNDYICFKDKKRIISFPVYFDDCKFFYCAFCHSLKSLEGSSENVSGNFNCAFCHSLKSLEGSSENVSGNFNCVFCDSLVSLEGVPLEINGDFICNDCKSLKFIDELKNIKIKKPIYYEGCLELKKYDSILKDMNTFSRWQKTDMTADEFLEEYSGFIDAQKYGI